MAWVRTVIPEPPHCLSQLSFISGFGLVSSILASRPEAFVYAGARDPPNATELEELAKTYPGRIAIVKCVSADAAGNADLAKLIKEKHGRVDTIIANAGASAILSLSTTKS